MPGRSCSFIKPNGQRCGAPPLQRKQLCFWHSPDRSQEVKQAQRLGGIRRKREKTVAVAYDVDGIRDSSQAFRVLEIALIDTLSLDNSVARNRTLVSIAQTGLKVLESSELEERVASLEAALQQQRPGAPVFDGD